MTDTAQPVEIFGQKHNSLKAAARAFGVTDKAVARAMTFNNPEMYLARFILFNGLTGNPATRGAACDLAIEMIQYAKEKM